MMMCVPFYHECGTILHLCCMDYWYDPNSLIFSSLLANLVRLVSQSSVLARSHESISLKEKQGIFVLKSKNESSRPLFPLFFIHDILCNVYVTVTSAYLWLCET